MQLVTMREKEMISSAVYQIKWNSTKKIAVSEAPETVTSSEVISRLSAPNTCVALCPYLEKNDCCLQPTTD